MMEDDKGVGNEIFQRLERERPAPSACSAFAVAV